MKNIIKISEILKISVVILIISVVSCNWLEVLPDNLPTIDDAFSNRATAEKMLFTCYSYLPDPVNAFGYPTYYTSKDEFQYDETNNQITSGYAARIAAGEQNSNSPILNYWPGMYQAIRTCNIFLEGIHYPRDMKSEEERNRWIAEVKFLKAYYHFFLLQLYGPIPLVKENLPIGATPDEVRVFREPVDECVAYIAQLIDEAVPDLPLTIKNNTDEDGRITKPIALTVKAKALAWRASSLFNGNPVYSGWSDSRGKQLVSTTYSSEKWVEAAAAIRNAIDVCHDAGNELYRFNKLAGSQTSRMNDSLVLTMNTRKAITDRWNKGIIWSSMNSFSRGKWGVPNNSAYDDMQQVLFPLLYEKDAGQGVAICCASFNMAELFYTNNGIPIDEDVNWDYAGRYQVRTSTAEAKNGSYIVVGQQTAALHFDREPRFYANLGFDRGYFELSTATTNVGLSFSPYVKLRSGETGGGFQKNYTGYYIKKLVAYESKGNPYSGYNYRFPLQRLSDLYLLYSEALNEMKNAPDEEVYKWIDQVREVAGLKGVVESWENSKYPNRPFDKTEMRKIIQQERMIELAFEGQRFWDVRRWKLAENLWTYAPKGWNNVGTTAEDYYNVVELSEARSFMLRDYLWPISVGDLRINKNLVQTYGW